MAIFCILVPGKQKSMFFLEPSATIKRTKAGCWCLHLILE